nr:retrotransposon protein, putative, Ty1-copia subclass [Tanacetum cinerariifolium]
MFNSRVDDILIMGNNISGLKEVKDYLGKCFSMKDLGEAAYIRDRSRRLIGLSQSGYIDKILKKYNMHNSKKGCLPMEVKHDLSNELCASTPEEVAYMKKVPYASVVGSIMYVVRCTRPDVTFAQNLVSRNQQNPGKLHWVAVKHILKYLRNTRDMFLVYRGKPLTGLDVIIRIISDSKIVRQSNSNKRKDIMMEKQAITLAEIGCHSGVDKVIGEGGFGKVYKGWLDSVTYNLQGADDKLALAVKISKPEAPIVTWMPSIFLAHRLTKKSDVYAFGVVLLETLCGRPALNFTLDEQQHSLAGWAKHCIKEVQDRPTMTNVLSQLEFMLQSANDHKRNGRTTFIEKARLFLSTKGPSKFKLFCNVVELVSIR